MAKYGPGDIIVSFDNSGGTPQTMTQYVTEIGDVSIEAMFEESQSFGDTWKEKLPIGLREMGDFTLSGFYDDTASTGPDAIFNAPAATVTVSTRTLALTFGGSKVLTQECYIKKYTRKPTRNGLTRYTVELTASGAPTSDV
jgi:hypothetical protein